MFDVAVMVSFSKVLHKKVISFGNGNLYFYLLGFAWSLQVDTSLKDL